MFNIKATLIALVVLVGMGLLGVFHADQAFAHQEVDMTKAADDSLLAEAQFYGIPTFNMETSEEKDVVKAQDELELLRRHFWGISVQTVVALFGAVLMLLFSVEGQEQAVHHIDANTIGLLIG
ncbi:hypothetical protein ADUPG1_007580, partial [Aduncisulcus paluster]